MINSLPTLILKYQCCGVKKKLRPKCKFDPSRKNRNKFEINWKKTTTKLKFNSHYVRSFFPCCLVVKNLSVIIT